jgi:hypothetical protein
MSDVPAKLIRLVTGAPIEAALKLLAGRKRPLLDQIAQGFPFDEIQGEEELFLDLPNLVDAADVGMAQSRSRLGLAGKAGSHRRFPIGRLR